MDSMEEVRELALQRGCSSSVYVGKFSPHWEHR